MPLIFLAWSGLSIPLLTASLFVRGAGIGAISIPANATGYAAVPRERLPTAATAINIGQRLGGPTCTTLCAVFLAWWSSAGGNTTYHAEAFAATFGLLAVIHILVILTTLPLPHHLPERA